MKHVNTKEATTLLKQGTIGVLPTDTIYGLVCRAGDTAAVERLYTLKKREAKPGTIIAADMDQLIELGIKARYVHAVQRFWPGAISVILPATELTYLHLGKYSLALRVVDDAKLRKMLTQTGPLLTTSANLTGEPVARTIAEAEAYFGDTIDFYVDGGDLSARKPSTMIRIIDDAVEVVRRGAVKIDEETGRIQK